MLTYPWKCTVLHCNHLGNTWKPLVLMTRHFDYCPSASEGDNQSVRSSAPVVFRCFPGGYNVKLYISRGRLAWWLLAFLHSDIYECDSSVMKSQIYHLPKFRYIRNIIFNVLTRSFCMNVFRGPQVYFTLASQKQIWLNFNKIQTPYALSIFVPVYFWLAAKCYTIFLLGVSLWR